MRHLLLPFLLLFATSTVATAGTTREREVVFKAADATSIKGTLTLPTQAGVTKPPAVLLIQGSGPTDRNGNQTGLTTDLLRQIADDLTKHGIATLRCDKRGQHANKDQLPAADKWPEFFAWQNTVTDAQNAIDFLRAQPEIDPKRIGILGHSEGGLIALSVATSDHFKDGPIASLILLSTPGRPADAVLQDQLARILQQQNATDPQAQFFLAENTRITTAIRNTGQVPADVPPGLKALYPAHLGPFLKGLFALDPPALAKAYSGPVLIVQGEKDIQVSTELDAKALDTALKTHPRDQHELFIAPGVSHNLKPIRDENDAGFEGPIDPKIQAKIRAWIEAAHLP